MITSMTRADEEMAELFRQAWVVTKGWKCEWANSKEQDHFADETWARWNIDYAFGGQTSMGGAGKRKFSRTGLIYVSVYTPLGAGLTTAREASEVAINAYEGRRTPGDVWFRNVRIESEGHGHGGGREKSWWTTLVVAEFFYEQLR